MNSKRALFILGISAIFALTSCSGLKSSVCTVNCGGGGGTSVPISFTLSAVPVSVPGSVSLLSFNVNVTTISLTSESTGNVTNLTPNNLVVDLNKLLSDSAYLGTYDVASDSYNKVQLFFTPEVVYCPSTIGVAGCTPGAIQKVTGTPTSLTFTYSPGLAPTSAGIGVRFRVFMARALVLNGAGTAITGIDFTQALVGFSEQLPLAANLASGQLDYVEDVTGVVTAVGTSSITLKTATAGTITANVLPGTSNFSTQTCTNNSISCAAVNQVADVDAILNADGTFTLLLFDLLDPSPDDWIEGVVSYAPTLSSQFHLVVTNFGAATTGSVFGSNLHLGDQVTVNIAGGTSFKIDQKDLTQQGVDNFTGGTDTSVMYPGQVVAVHPTTFTAANGTTPAVVNVNSLTLRYSRLSGAPGSSGTNFPISPFDPYLGISGSPLTYETSGVTNYDLPTSGPILDTTAAAGIRALYFGPPTTSSFAVAKVRQ
ncbi:MAG: hypothetical protein ACHQT6_02470 [Candidatus Acidiferrales bacterium]